MSVPDVDFFAIAVIIFSVFKSTLCIMTKENKQMVKKYIFGSVFNTEAVVEDIAVSSDSLPYLGVHGNDLLYKMSDDDIVYGLGENVRGINKRGWRYISRCTDQTGHSESTQALYAAHNFLIVDGAERFGVFVDTPAEVTFDVGFTALDTLRIEGGAENCAVYIIEGESLSDIVKQLRKLTGSSYIPPKWAFGHQQSRWGYSCSDDVRAVVRKHAELGCPLDSVYLDIDYMDEYKDFTIDRRRFPDFEALTAEMKEKGVRLVPIIDAAVKVQEGYDVYEEGVEKGYFCTGEDGKPFEVAVWPGRSCLPDVLNPEAREWFGKKYECLISRGIDGFWNDMNEPSIFYTDKTLNAAYDYANKVQESNIDINSYFILCEMFTGNLRSAEQYKDFYHNTPEGRISHDKVHNIYGYNMTRAAMEAFGKIAPDRRILLFSRSSYIGMHRFGGIWTGDNTAHWDHLAMNLKMMPSINMCGFLYSGADLGGFGGNVSEDLLTRWLQFGIFTPLMRNHTAWNCREKEVYQFPSAKYLSEIIKLRYRLIPYLYSEYVKAAKGNDMLFKPLSFVFENDSDAARIEDQLMWGESVMIAPVLEQNARGRYVYLPEDMLMVRWLSADEYKLEPMSAGRHYIEIPLREMVFFIRKGHLLPLCASAEHVRDLDASKLTVIGYGEGELSYELIDDDGESISGIGSIVRKIVCTTDANGIVEESIAD